MADRYAYGDGSMGWEPEPGPFVERPDDRTVPRRVLVDIVSDLSCPIPQVESALELAKKWLAASPGQAG